MSSAMSKPTLDADTILKRAAAVTGQHAHEIQPFGHLVRMPIALSEHACKESVDNLNQLLAAYPTSRIRWTRRREILRSTVTPISTSMPCRAVADDDSQ